MTDKTPTTAMAHAPATVAKTDLITDIQALLDEIDTTRTKTVSGDSQAFTVAVAGTPTAGTYDLTIVGDDKIASQTIENVFNATAASIQAAIRALTGEGLSQTTVTQSGSTPNLTHTITFKGVQEEITLTRLDETTGGTHSVTVTETVEYAPLPRLSAQAAINAKNDLIDWAQNLASNLRRG